MMLCIHPLHHNLEKIVLQIQQLKYQGKIIEAIKKPKITKAKALMEI